jgi:hypothetical protein
VSEALRLADAMDSVNTNNADSLFVQMAAKSAAAELRRLSGVEQELEAHKAARMAYASEFPLNKDGEPDVGNIHQNIRAMKAELEALKRAISEAEPVRVVTDIRTGEKVPLYTLKGSK